MLRVHSANQSPEQLRQIISKGPRPLASAHALNCSRDRHFLEFVNDALSSKHKYNSELKLNTSIVSLKSKTQAERMVIYQLFSGNVYDAKIIMT